MKSAKSTVERMDVEELLKILGEKSPVGVCIIQDGKFCYVNPSFPIVTGYTTDELEGMDSLEIVVPEDREMVRENVIKMLKGKLLSPCQFRVICKDGSIKWLMETVRSIRYHGKRATLGNYMEITERKQTEESLQAEKNKLQSLVDAMEHGLTIQDTEYNIIYQNGSGKRDWGDHLGEKCYRVYEGREKVCDGCPVEKAFKDARSHTAVRRTVLPSGEVAFWENTANPVRDAQGRVVACLEIANNVTEREQAEKALEKSEERYKELANSITDIFFAMDEHLRYTYWNRASEVLTGIRAEDAIGKSLREIFPDVPWMRKAEKVYRNVLKTQQPQTFVNEADIDGRHYTFEISAYPSRDSISVFVRDVTERKQAEEALRQSEENYRALFDSAVIGTIVLDAETMKVVMSNQAAAKMVGFSSVEEAIGVNGIEFLPLENRERILELAAKNLFEQDLRQTFEFQAATKDGREIWISVTGARIMHKGRLAGLISFTDITERKQAEEKIKESEQKYRLLFETSLDYIAQIDREGRYLAANPAVARSLGVPLEELVGKTLFEVMPKKVAQRRLRDVRKVLDEWQPQIFEDERAGRYFHHIVIPTKISEQKEAVQVITRDITERRKMEEALRQGEEKYRALFNSAVVGMVVLDAETMKVAMVNQAALNMFGFSSVDEAIVLNPLDFIVPKDRERALENTAKDLFEQNSQQAYEFRAVTKDGREIWISTTGTRIMHEGRLAGLISFTDITARKQAEEKLRQSRERYRALFDSSVIGTLVVDAETMQVVMGNQAAVKMFGFGSAGEGAGLNPLDFIPPEDKEKNLERIVKEVFEKDSRKSVDLRAVTKDGKEIWISVTGARIMHKGRLAGLLSFTDITERKQAEEALQRSEEKYRTILEQMEDAYFEVDLGGHLTFVNNSVCRDLGYSREELIGMSYKGFTIEDDIESVFRVFNEVYQTAIPNKGFPWNIIRKDGSRGFAETSVSPLRNDKGEIVGFRGVGRDVTERRKIVEALQQSEVKYRALFDSAVIGTFVLDAETMKVAMGNQAAADAFGFSSVEEAIGVNPLDLIPPEDRERVLEIITKSLFEQDTRQTYDIRAVTKDGREIWISATGARTMHAGRLAGLISFTDITERKQAEEALRQSEENYRALFDNSVIGTIVLDAETMKIAMVNQAAAKMFGFSSAEEASGIDPLVFIRPDDKERILDIAVKALFEEDSRAVYELGAVTKDGREIWINATGARVMHEGKLAGLICFTDITEEKRQRERLMITDRLASLGELASGTAHELNNPLTSIVGFSQLLIEREVPDDIREDLKLINNEAQRAARVTKNLLTFARKHAPMKQLTQINNIIEDVLKLRAHEHVTNSIVVEKQLDPDLPEIMVDYFQMQQVFINIVINAEYFMTEAHNRGTLTVTTKKQNNTVVISFTDDGPGIPPENLRRIFDPFFTTKGAGKGTGLGLSICHGIVAEHGGQIYARSQPGEGTTFFVELPIGGR
jgi:PAS domain S-box-containing protein